MAPLMIADSESYTYNEGEKFYLKIRKEFMQNNAEMVRKWKHI